MIAKRLLAPPGLPVTTVATARPGVAEISGAWKTEPASP